MTVQIGEAADTLLELVEERKEIGGVDLLGYETGFRQIDEYTGGIEASDVMWVVAASTSVGKSSFALQTALNVARKGVGTVVYSLEMSAQSLVNRLLSSYTQIPAGRIVRGKVDETEYKKLVEASNLFRGLPLYLNDDSHTSDSLSEHAKRLKEEKKGALGFVVCDYLGLLTDPEPHGKTQKMSAVSNKLRALAKPDQADLAVLSLVQLNRTAQTGEEARPRMAMIKDSGSIEQDAHVVLLLHRPSVMQRERGAIPQDVETDAEIIIAKNRNGPALVTEATFYPRTMQWKQG